MQHKSRSQGGRPHNTGAGRNVPTLDTSAIVLKKADGRSLDPALFDDTAHAVARVIGENSYGNKPSQIRKFYDELVMWEEKVLQDRDKFEDYLPFIRMLNAKAAYAQGRKNVDSNFTQLISHCLGQVDSVDTLHNFKLFFEAFLGFYKLESPRG